MATDRAGIVKAGEAGVAEVTDSLVTKSTWAERSDAELDKTYDALPSYDYDVAAAKKLVAGKGLAGKKIVIATSPISTAAGRGRPRPSPRPPATSASQVELKTISPGQVHRAVQLARGARRASTCSSPPGTPPWPTRWTCTTCCAPASSATTAAGPTPTFDAAANKAIATPLDDPARAAAVADGAGRGGRAAAVAAAVRRRRRRSGWVSGSPASAPSINYIYYPWAATIGSK